MINFQLQLKEVEWIIELIYNLKINLTFKWRVYTIIMSILLFLSASIFLILKTCPIPEV